jgi:molybdopterin-guanine dinucleotide biosynthesis protein B
MKVVGFAGYSGSGKTTLIERVIPRSRLRGLRVSVVKHAHHNFDIDQPGKDTYRHREAGAFEVVVASDRRLALMREFEQPAQLSVHHLIAELYDGVDWVLVEGFKQSNLLKLEVWRAQPASRCAIPTTTSSWPSPPTSRRCRRKPCGRCWTSTTPRRGAVAGRQCRPLRLQPRVLRVSPRPPLRSLDEALADLLGRKREPLAETETVATFDADGRVLAEDLVSALQVPPQDNSSMDGYAVRRAEIADEGVPLPVSQRIPAGQAGAAAAARHGGAHLHRRPGAARRRRHRDAGRHRARWATGVVRILRVPDAGQWIRRSGEDVCAGTVVLQRGQRLDPAACGLAASIGRDRCRSRGGRAWRCSPPATNW